MLLSLSFSEIQEPATRRIPTHKRSRDEADIVKGDPPAPYLQRWLFLVLYKYQNGDNLR